MTFLSFSCIKVIILKLGVPHPSSSSFSPSLVLNTNKGLFLSNMRLRNRIISFLVCLSLESMLRLLWSSWCVLPYECELCAYLYLWLLFLSDIGCLKLLNAILFSSSLSYLCASCWGVYNVFPFSLFSSGENYGLSFAAFFSSYFCCCLSFCFLMN